MISSWARTGPVVVEVDGSAKGLRVVDYACQEALRSGAELVLAVHYPAHSPFSPMTPGHPPEPPADLAEANLQIAVGHVRRQQGFGLQLHTVSQQGSRLKALPQLARHARALVVGATTARGPQRVIAAQGNLFLAARTGCPVVVVPRAWEPSGADRSVSVGIDGSRLSLEAVEFAFRTAADREGELTVVHAANVPHRERAGSTSEESWLRRADLTLAETLAGWSEQYPQVKVEKLLTGGPVVAALLREGREAGLVVLGTHSGHSLLTDPVARRAVAELACPVAIVPHHVTEAERAQRRRELGQGADAVLATY